MAEVCLADQLAGVVAWQLVFVVELVVEPCVEPFVDSSVGHSSELAALSGFYACRSSAAAELHWGACRSAFDLAC